MSRPVGIPAADDSAVLTLDDFTRRYRISKVRIYQLLARGEIEARKYGQKTLITMVSAERWLNNLPKYESAGKIGRIRPGEARAAASR